MSDGMSDGPDLTGLRIAIVEDEHVVATSLARMLEILGAVIVGPVPTVARALALLRATARIDGAVVDLNLRGVMAFPVADALIARGVPFVFATGYGKSVIPEFYGTVPVLQKPYDPVELATALFPHAAVRPYTPGRA
jgi:CheY-like chemotaxis protein